MVMSSYSVKIEYLYKGGISMSETIGVNVLKRASNMEISPQFDGYSAVRIFVGTDDDGNAVIYEAGNTDGRTLEIKNPLVPVGKGQEMAEKILSDIQGYQYQPLSADNALLDPAAEMGDGVTVNGVYSGIFVRATQFGRLMASDVSAPTDEEIEHEFAIESASDRQYTRFVQQTKAMLKITNMAIEAEVEARETADTAINATLAIHASDIQARVTKQSPSGQSSFGWNLTDSEWTVFSGNTSNTILRASSSGLEVKGKVTATSGEIGGFTIGATSIYSNGMSSMQSGQTTGVHLGTDGIKLGQRFKVDTSGNVDANNINLTGTLNFYNGSTFLGSVTAQNFKSQVDHSYTSTTSGGYCYGGAGHGYSYNSATVPGTGTYPSYFKCGTFYATTGISCGGTVSAKLSSSDFTFNGWRVGWKTLSTGELVLGYV